MRLLAPKLSILEEVFGESNITVILKYQGNLYDESGYRVTLYNDIIAVDVTPPVTVVSNGTHFELMLFYNTQYNASASITLCEVTVPSITSEFFYGM